MGDEDDKWKVLETVGSCASDRGAIQVEIAAYDKQPPKVYLSRAKKDDGHKKLGGMSAQDIKGLLPLLETAAASKLL